MDSKIDIPRRKKRIVYIPANDASLPAVYDIYLPANGTVLEVKRSLADAAGIGPEDDVDIEEKTLMFSVYNHCIHRVFQNESKTNVLEDVEGLLYLCEVKSSKSYVDIELTNRLPSGLTPFGHPTVIPIPRPQLSSISLKDLRVIVRSGITPFLKDGWQPGEKDSDLYSIVIMDEAASSIRHEIQYDIQTVNLKQFVGKRGGFSVSLLWKKAARHRYIDRFFTFLAHPKSILVPNAGVKPDGGYPDTIFCNPDTVRDFICPICMDVVRDPMETECGHLFCMQCVDRLLDGINKEKLCPMKCGMISKASVHPLGNFTKRKVMAFAVQCISAPDCEWKGKLLQFNDHVNSCEFAQVECSGCLETMQWKEFKDHLANDCTYRIEACTFCDQQVLFKELKFHHGEECMRAPRHCPHADCGFVGARDEIPPHTITCIHRPLGCPYHRFGCPVHLKDTQLSQHVQAATADHLELVMHRVGDLEGQIEKLRDLIINPRSISKRSRKIKGGRN